MDWFSGWRTCRRRRPSSISRSRSAWFTYATVRFNTTRFPSCASLGRRSCYSRLAFYLSISTFTLCILWSVPCIGYDRRVVLPGMRDAPPACVTLPGMRDAPRGAWSQRELAGTAAGWMPASVSEPARTRRRIPTPWESGQQQPRPLSDSHPWTLRPQSDHEQAPTGTCSRSGMARRPPKSVPQPA